MVVNTWFNAVSGTAWAHTVPLATGIGTEKKYCDKGVEDICRIVSHGLRAPPDCVEQPVISEP